jgi:hypothetical protein
VGYKSSSIIKYSLTGDLFIAYYVYCIFNEEHFPKIGEISSTRMDPRTQEIELQFWKIVSLLLARVEVLIKTTQLPNPKKRGSSTTSDQEPTSHKQHMRERRKSSKSVNANQFNVCKHLMGSTHSVEGQLLLAYTGHRNT